MNLCFCPLKIDKKVSLGSRNVCRDAQQIYGPTMNQLCETADLETTDAEENARCESLPK